MPRHISFFLTTPQFLDGSKDVTRRLGWEGTEAGDLLMAVEKAQGLGKGGKMKRLGLIRVVLFRPEPLSRMTDDLEYGKQEVIREGFPQMTPAEFVEFFMKANKMQSAGSLVNRIEFERTLSEAGR